MISGKDPVPVPKIIPWKLFPPAGRDTRSLS